MRWWALWLMACEAAPPPVDYYAPQTTSTERALSGGPLQVYLNLCAGGCVVAPGPDDARANTSRIATASVALSETKLRPDEQDAMVRCLYRVFEPFDLEFVFREPEDGPYVEAMIGGRPTDLGQPPGIAGVSPMDCRLLEGVINFTFGEVIGRGELGDFEAAGEAFCGVIAHETGHTIGLDHAYFCEDLMTYLPACVEEQRFTRADTTCGEHGERACACGGNYQNSHLKVLAEVGARSRPVDLPPKLRISNPKERDFFRSGEAIVVEATDNETYVTRVWARIGATDLGARSEPPYTFTTPYDLPEGDTWIQAWATDSEGHQSTSDRLVNLRPGRRPYDGGQWDAAGPRPQVPEDAGFIDAAAAAPPLPEGGCGCSGWPGAAAFWIVLGRRRR